MGNLQQSSISYTEEELILHFGEDANAACCKAKEALLQARQYPFQQAHFGANDQQCVEQCDGQEDPENAICNEQFVCSEDEPCKGDQICCRRGACNVCVDPPSQDDGADGDHGFFDVWGGDKVVGKVENEVEKLTGVS